MLSAHHPGREFAYFTKIRKFLTQKLDATHEHCADFNFLHFNLLGIVPIKV